MAVHSKRASLALLALTSTATVLAACEGQTEPALGQTSSAISSPPESGCTMQRFGEHEYWFCPTPRTADDAQLRCAAQPWMHLARIDSAAEQGFIDTHAAGSAWIGGHDQQVEGEWRWSDDGDQFWQGAAAGSAAGGLHTRWASGQPDDNPGTMPPAATTTALWNPAAITNPTGTCTIAAFGDSAYWTCTSALSWDTARGRCTAVGADLASVTTAAESAFVNNIASGTTAWNIGLQRRGLNGSPANTWRWLDGSDPFSFSNWASGEPNTSGSSCGVIEADLWKDWLCTTTRQFICEDTTTMPIPDAQGPQLVDLLTAQRRFTGSTAALTNGVSVSGLGCSIAAASTDAVFLFNLSSETQVMIDVTSGTFANARLALFRGTLDSAGYAAAGNRCSAPLAGSAIELQASLAAGAYYLVISSTSGTGAYDIAFNSDPAADCARTSGGTWADDACSATTAQHGYVCESDVSDCTIGQDQDADGVPDCFDECPLDASHIVEGDCGCPSAATPTGTACNDGMCAANTACDGAGNCGAPEACAPDTSCTFERFGTSAYFFCDNLRTAAEARAQCALTPGMHLVHVGSEEEHDFLVDRIADATWIGATDATLEGDWRWPDDNTQLWSGGLNGAPVAGRFIAWRTARAPDDVDGLGWPTADCAALERDLPSTTQPAAWSDYACHDQRQRFAFTCEMPLGFDCPLASDLDGDGTLDCYDTCPLDPDRVEPGDCGCSDAAAPAGTSCDDGYCAGTAQCNGAGQCGNPAACAPAATCTPRRHAGKVYWQCPGTYSWTAARDMCRTRTGVDLVRIDSQAENDFVRSLVTAPTWIGANDRTVETDWRWTARPSDDGPQLWEGSNNTPVNGLFSKWGASEPGAEDCAQIQASGAWRDLLCTTATFGAVCETALDNCALDPIKLEPGVCGCGVADTDGDADGTASCLDGCPTDSNKVQPLFCGCGQPETDSDGDSTPNCVDACPSDGSKVSAGICGCGVADTDGDHDGVPDCQDGCPTDVRKTDPGACGCGMTEIDSDGDLVPDCDDECAADPEKIAAGACGCGVPDVDSDGDHTIDCIDECPSDATKVVSGDCGCNDGTAEPAGTACDDGLCSLNTSCNGHGQCGTIAQCAPEAGCTYEHSGGSLYFFCPSGRSWSQASDACSARGFALPRVNSAAENAYLSARGSSLWLGARDLSEGTWTWQDNTTFWSGGASGSSVGGNYANWVAGQPDDLFGPPVTPPVATLTQLWDATLAAAAPPAPATCTGHIHQSRAYWICTDTRTWDNARAACQAAGGDLVSSTPQAEDDFVAPLTFGAIYHAGLQRRGLVGAASGTWQWLDGSLIGAWNHWGWFEPFGSDTCAAMDGAWRTIGCATAQRYACERANPALSVPDLDSPQAVDVYGTMRLFQGNTLRTQNVVDGALMGCSAGSAAPDAVFSFTLTSRTRVTIDLAGSAANTKVGLFSGAISASGYVNGGSRCASVGTVIDVTLQSGTYYAVVTGDGSNAKQYRALFTGYRDGTLNADCARLEPADAGRWRDSSCADSVGYACEVPVDECPADGAKLTAGQCGCGRAETDGDGDGTPDCIDGCPMDSSKIDPGDCGCANQPFPAGRSCGDGMCAENTACDGAGSCGDPMECAPEPSCIFATYPGASSRGYFLCPNTHVWTAAEARCETVPRGQLARVDNAIESTFIGASMIGFEEAWIGANDRTAEGTWRWRTYGNVNGDQFWQGAANGTGVGGLYTNWTAGEPNDLFGEECGTIYADGFWNDDICDWPYPYVCEIGGDLCPDDPGKWEPGVCGCGLPDDDSDGDGARDCVDSCPFDAARDVAADGHCAFTYLGSDIDSAIGAPIAHAGAADGSGNVLVVAQVAVGDHTEIHARRLSALGTLLDFNPIVLDVDVALGFAAEPRVAGLGVGWAVTWTAEDADRDGSGIMYRLVSAAGVPAALRTANADQLEPAEERFFQHGARIAALNDGFVIAWVTEAFPGDEGAGLRARLFSNAGLPRSRPFFIATTRAGDQTRVEIAANGAEWMAAWEDRAEGDVRARRFVAAGAVAEEEVFATGAHSPAVSRLAGDGDFAVVWIDASFDAYGARSMPGEPHDLVTRVMTTPDGRPELAPRAVAYGDVLAVGLSYERGDDGDFAIVDPLDIAPTPAQLAPLRALLRGISNQTQVGLIQTPAGVWVTWVDDSLDYYDGALQLAGYFIPAP